MTSQNTPRPTHLSLSKLPVAKGSPSTRRCVVCRKAKPLTEYPRPPKGKCASCFFGGLSTTYRVSGCAVCGEPFTAKSSRAILCGAEACERVRATTLDRERRAAIRAGERVAKSPRPRRKRRKRARKAS